MMSFLSCVLRSLAGLYVIGWEVRVESRKDYFCVYYFEVAVQTRNPAKMHPAEHG